MVLLIASALCAFCALVAASILKFSLPGWQSLAGLSRIPADRLCNIDVPRLRSRISVLLFALAGGCAGGALAVYLKVIPETYLIPFFYALAFVIFNAVWFAYRKFDRNEYSDAARRASRLFHLAVNLLLSLACILFLR